MFFSYLDLKERWLKNARAGELQEIRNIYRELTSKGLQDISLNNMKVTNGFFNKTDKIFRYNHIYFIEYSSSLG